MSRNIKKLVFRTTAGILFFATSCAAGYMLTPMRKRNIKLGDNLPEDTVIDSDVPENFMRFVSRLNEDTGILDDRVKAENTYYGFNFQFDDFSVSFKKDEYSVENVIGIDGNLDLMLKTIKNITFNLDVDVEYNGKNLPLEVGYIDKTAYFGLKDLRLKVGSTSIDELIGNEEKGIDSLLYQLFMASKEDGGINFDLEAWLDDKVGGLIRSKLNDLISGFDLSEMSSLALKPLGEGEQGFGIKVDEKAITDGLEFTLDLQIRNESMDNEFTIVLDVDNDYRLTRVDLGEITIGNVTIKGAININTIADYRIAAPDSEEYAHRAPRNYVEIINYKGWLQKLANFLDEDNQKFGFDFALDLDEKSGVDTADFAGLVGSLNADFSKLIDLSDYEMVPTRSAKRGLFDDLANKVRSGVSLGLDLHILDKNDEEISNLSISYVEGQGFLKLNETIDTQNNKKAVIKSKVDESTMNWIIDELPGMIATMSVDGTDSDAIGELFSFVTESSFVSAIKGGDYSVVLDLLKNISNDENAINLDLDLSSLGLGNNAEVNLSLDSRTESQNKVLNLGIKDVEMGDFVLNAALNSEEFSAINVDDVETYDEMSYLPTVFDQVSTIVKDKKTGFTIQGSVLDGDGVGITLDGKGQLDLDKKYGFGDLTLNEYKYKGAGLYYSHKLAIDVDNTTSDYTKNNAHFVYGEKNGDNIKGKVTVQSVLDIIDIAKQFMNDNADNPKFTKFIEPITKMMAMGEFSNIINEKDYLRLLKNDVIKSAKKNGDQLDLIIGGYLFDLEHDMTIRVNLKNNKIDSLELLNFELSGGKLLNIKIALADFDANRESSVDKSNMNSFMDLSSISLLLKFGINTTKNNYWHLTANIHLNLGVVDLSEFQLDVYIVVQDSYCKIYGVIEDSKLLAIDFVVQRYGITTSGLKSEFTFETYPDGDPNKEDGVGGYFDFKVTETRMITGRKTYVHYRTTSKNMLEGDNLLKYLLGNFLYISDSILDKIGSVSLNKDEQKPAGDFTKTFTSTGFNYNESQKKWSIGLNLDVLTGVDALKDLEINLYGNNQEKFAGLQGKLNIEATKIGSLAITIGLEFDVTLENINETINDWSSSIQSKFNTIRSVAFSSEYLNNPNKYLTK